MSKIWRGPRKNISDQVSVTTLQFVSKENLKTHIYRVGRENLYTFKIAAILGVSPLQRCVIPELLISVVIIQQFQKSVNFLCPPGRYSPLVPKRDTFMLLTVHLRIPYRDTTAFIIPPASTTLFNNPKILLEK